MLIRRPSGIVPSEITPRVLFEDRRQFIRDAGLFAAAAGFATAGVRPRLAHAQAKGFPALEKGAYPLSETATPLKDITTYNNFYEFGTGKADPAETSKDFKTKPWTVKVEGLVKKPAEYHLEDFIKPHKLEDRTYRHRCVEAWSMVIPWQGFPMADFIKRVEPLPSAKFIQFQTLYDPIRMPGQQRAILPWPYTEGLRLDEAMHPLAMFGTGLYGKTLLPQNGAPLRTIIPWKYGFKATKSIVKVVFTEQMPRNTWNVTNASEYGFYGNVNPEVDHPRWTQSKERRIGEFRRRATLMFNGYPAVASLYSGMDLRVNY